MSNEMPEKIYAYQGSDIANGWDNDDRGGLCEYPQTEYIRFDLIDTGKRELYRQVSALKTYIDRSAGHTNNLLDELIELRRQNAALKEFAIKINQKAWECGDVDGGEVQELGEAFGIIEPHNVTQEDHDKGQYTDWNIGDPMFQLTDWMLTDTAAMPAPSKAEVAREFLREIIPRAQKTQKYFQEIGFDKVKHDYVALNDIDYALSFAVAFKEVLKEWEDAEK